MNCCVGVEGESGDQLLLETQVLQHGLGDEQIHLEFIYLHCLPS